MNRRQFLSATAIGATTLLTGCTNNNGNDDSDGGEPLDGEWVLRARVVNEDDEPREWRVESRSEDRESVVAASGTLSGDDEHELELSGSLYDEQREVSVESDGGTVSERWHPVECRDLSAVVNIIDGNPSMETECLEE